VKNTNHHILDRAFLQHINILQTVRLHLEGAFGETDPVYEASCSVRSSAPKFFASTMLGVSKSFDNDGETVEPLVIDEVNIEAISP
jgi:hypothetical protein